MSGPRATRLPPSPISRPTSASAAKLLYNTFGDKHTLFLKALDHYHQTMGENIVERLGRPDGGLEAIRETFPKPPSGTSPGNPAEAAASSPTPSPSAGRTMPHSRCCRCNRSREQLERGFRLALTRARDRGELPPHVQVDATATLLVIQNYGLNALAKTGATAEELEAAMEALLAGLG